MRGSLIDASRNQTRGRKSRVSEREGGEAQQLTMLRMESFWNPNL